MRAARPFLDSDYALALVLAALAGWIDATAYLYGHQIYVSFMSGNSTMISVAAASQDKRKEMAVGAVLLAFIAGVIVGEVIAKKATRYGRSWTLVTEAMLLAAAAILAHAQTQTTLTLAALALAMGAQNAEVHEAGKINVALTYVTGTLVRFGRSIASGLLGEGHWEMAAAYFCLWLAFVSGALLGAAVTHYSPVTAMTTVGVGALALAAMTARTAPRAT